MMKTLMLGASCAGLIMASAGAVAPKAKRVAAPAVAASANPLLQPWTGPYGGVPAFDKVKVADFKPALRAGHGDEPARRSTRSPTTRRRRPSRTPSSRWRRPGKPLTRLIDRSTASGRGNLNDARCSRRWSTRWSPKLAAFDDEIIQNAKLFARIEAVYNSPAKAKLTPEQQRLVWVTWQQLRPAGRQAVAGGQGAAVRDQPASSRRSTPSSARTSWPTRRTGARPRPSQTDLAGLPKAQVERPPRPPRRKRPARASGAITNTRSSMEPFLTYSADRALREKVFRMWTSRGDNGDAHDNNAIITRDPEAARREGASCSATRPTRTGSWTTPWRRRPTPR